MSAKVSMIIACYNKAQYIGNTLRSIFNQTWNDIEVILVNDGSTDETERIIREWRPYLLARGFDVIVISQDNMGVATAIKNGLIRSNGEYVCFPDADDELDAEYVSEMMKSLEESNADFAVCKMASRRVSDGIAIPVTYIDEITPNTTIEQVLLRRVLSSVCIYLIKREYAERCGLMHMVTENAASQEPQITTLLFSHGGKLVRIDKILYIYNVFSSSLAGKQFYKNSLTLYEQTIEQLTLSSEEKTRLKSIASIGCTYMASVVFTENDAANEIFFRSITNTILGIKPQFPHIAGRIIAFGSLGEAAKKLLPLLKGTPLQPDIFCDRAAGSETVVYDGAPIVKQDKVILCCDDVLLCTPKSSIAYAEAQELAANYGAKVFSWNKIVDYLADWYYQNLMKK